MKKLFIFLVAVISTVSVCAQETLTDLQKMQSGISLDWLSKKPKDFNTVSADYIYKHIVIGGAYGWSNDANDDPSKGSVMKKMNLLDIHVGGNYRYFLNKNFFVEGRMFVGYNHRYREYLAGKEYVHSTYGVGRTRDTKDEESDLWKTWGEGYMYVGVSPRIGINFNGIAVNIGYRWDFEEFKFDKSHKDDKFTVGVAYLF